MYEIVGDVKMGYSILEYVLIGAGSGLLWSILQFTNRVLDKKKGNRWKDFDYLRTGLTCLYNSLGAGLGVWLVPKIPSIEIQRSVWMAVSSGFVGEEILKGLSRKGKELWNVLISSDE